MSHYITPMVRIREMMACMDPHLCSASSLHAYHSGPLPRWWWHHSGWWVAPPHLITSANLIKTVPHRPAQLRQSQRQNWDTLLAWFYTHIWQLQPSIAIPEPQHCLSQWFLVDDDSLAWPVNFHPRPFYKFVSRLFLPESTLHLSDPDISLSRCLQWKPGCCCAWQGAAVPPCPWHEWYLKPVSKMVPAWRSPMKPKFSSQCSWGRDRVKWP